MKHFKSILKNGWAWVSFIVFIIAILGFFASQETIRYYRNKSAMYQNNWQACEEIVRVK